MQQESDTLNGPYALPRLVTCAEVAPFHGAAAYAPPPGVVEAHSATVALWTDCNNSHLHHRHLEKSESYACNDATKQCSQECRVSICC